MVSADPMVDGLGSVTSLSNSAGALANTYTYDSFGKVTASTGSITNPFQYTAREFDSETNLNYYRARYYCTSVGRFLNEDAQKFLQGSNFYAYVFNNPENAIDPTGWQTRPTNLPQGTPQQYWDPFSDGFAEALKRFKSGKCAELFESTCHYGPYTEGADRMRDTTYRFLALERPSTGAATPPGGEIFINIDGDYMTAKSGRITLPGGITYDLGSITNVRAFILLHELGHQLSPNTGFKPDAGLDQLNAAHSIAIINACFK
jgi:RHS repeat-associated protein